MRKAVRSFSQAKSSTRSGTKRPNVANKESAAAPLVCSIIRKVFVSPAAKSDWKIKESFWKQDQKAKEAVNDRVDDALRAGTPGGNVVENQYVPKGHKQRV